MQASPHTRGWTLLGRAPRMAGVGFPAHAGMDPPRRRMRASCPWLPRTRGDGPRPSPPACVPAPASPHTRGWTRAAGGRVRPHHGFPAHAGMDRCCGRSGSGWRRLPRTRGDGPVIWWVVFPLNSASPHTRGWTVPACTVARRCRGFPAHAGMDPTLASSWTLIGRLPRTRGDGPASASVLNFSPSASPHTRGWTRRQRCAGGEGAGFPAHAGMDPWWWRRRSLRPGLPRTRGDGPRRSRGSSQRGWASPHTRGWTRRRRSAPRRTRGFPAHAGMDPRTSADAALRCRLPRTRGDGPWAGTPWSPATTASPHTRGWTAGIESAQRFIEGFPAHAGMDP